MVGDGAADEARKLAQEEFAAQAKGLADQVIIPSYGQTMEI